MDCAEARFWTVWMWMSQGSKWSLKYLFCLVCPQQLYFAIATGWGHLQRHENTTCMLSEAITQPSTVVICLPNVSPKLGATKLLCCLQTATTHYRQPLHYWLMNTDNRRESKTPWFSEIIQESIRSVFEDSLVNYEIFKGYTGNSPHNKITFPALVFR